MLGELLKPSVTDEDCLLLTIFLINLEAATLCFCNDVEHELPLESAEHSEEEVALRQAACWRAAPLREGTCLTLGPSWHPHRGSSLRALDIEGFPVWSPHSVWDVASSQQRCHAWMTTLFQTSKGGRHWLFSMGLVWHMLTLLSHVSVKVFLRSETGKQVFGFSLLHAWSFDHWEFTV